MQLIYNILSKISLLTFSLAGFFILGACHNEEPDNPSVSSGEKTSILLYAVASNNLSSNLIDDMNEIKRGASKINLGEADIYIYAVRPSGNPKLFKLVMTSPESYDYSVVKEYDRSLFSTDPRRISEVIGDYLSRSDAVSRGLILWSHATGWMPEFSNHIVPELNKSFGADQFRDPNTNKPIMTDYCDLLELDAAIPENTFDYIWFDCCYMGAIEVAYQLRNKANFIVGSAMELAGEGMPYQLTIPFLARLDYSLSDALVAETEYFQNGGDPFTLVLIDTKALESLADAARTIMTGSQPDTFGLLNYAHNGVYPAYDLKQYLTAYYECNNPDILSVSNANFNPDSPVDSDNMVSPDKYPEKFYDILNKVILYKSSSNKTWSFINIDEENYSGLSIFDFEDIDVSEMNYYRRLDWYIATRLNNQTGI